MQQNGDIVIVGSMSQTVDFGGGPLVSAGLRDIFVATFDSTGAHVWSQRYGDSADQLETDEENAWLSMRLDDAGHIYVGGSLYGTLDFGGQQLVAAGDSGNPDVFYFELAADGSFQGGRNFGGTGSDHTYDLEVAPSGHIVLVGRFTGSTLDFGTGIPLVKVERSDAYIVLVLPLPVGPVTMITP